MGNTPSNLNNHNIKSVNIGNNLIKIYDNYYDTYECKSCNNRFDKGKIIRCMECDYCVCESCYTRYNKLDYILCHDIVL